MFKQQAIDNHIPPPVDEIIKYAITNPIYQNIKRNFRLIIGHCSVRSDM